jgi:predicted alpha/beta superfamily hydrolase
MIGRTGLALACFALAVVLSSCESDADNPVATSGLPFSRTWITHVDGYRDNRAIYVHFPPNYTRTLRTFPVLVVLDGQTAFGGPNTFGLERVMDSLTIVGTIPPTVVVGIASASGEQRFTEYIPSEGGEAFLDGVRDTILPALRARYRITDDPDSTAILGASLGGIMAADAGFTHDDTFRRVAGLSVSYWAGQILTTMRTQGHGGLERFYQDTGDGDDNRFQPLQAVETLARDSLGFTPDCDIKTVLAHGDHDYNSWSHRMPSIIAYLLGPPGDACGVALGRP